MPESGVLLLKCTNDSSYSEMSLSFAENSSKEKCISNSRQHFLGWEAAPVPGVRAPPGVHMQPLHVRRSFGKTPKIKNDISAD